MQNENQISTKLWNAGTSLGPCSSEMDWCQVERVYISCFLEIMDEKDHPHCYQSKVQKPTSVMVWYDSGHGMGNNWCLWLRRFSNHLNRRWWFYLYMLEHSWARCWSPTYSRCCASGVRMEIAHHEQLAGGALPQWVNGWMLVHVIKHFEWLVRLEMRYMNTVHWTVKATLMLTGTYSFLEQHTLPSRWGHVQCFF